MDSSSQLHESVRMVASSTLVNVAEDAEQRLVAVLGADAGEKFQATCTACIAAGDSTKLIKTVTSSDAAMKTFLTLETVEAVAAISLLATLLQKSDKFSAALHKFLVDAIVGLGGSELGTSERKLTLLSVLYNMLPEKCYILKCMIELAGTHTEQLLHPETALGRLLSSRDKAFANASAPRVVALLDSWDKLNETTVTIADRRMLFSTVCNVMPATDIRKQRFLLLLVETYDGGKGMDDAGLTAAKDAAIGAIRNPVLLFQQQRNLSSRTAILALAVKDAELLSLLKIFQEGKLTDYEAFFANKDEANVLAQWGLDAKECERFMRILSLISLAAEHEEIPYSVIAETLKLPGGTTEVETWVIAAVNSGLLQAKMDQLAQKVMVERCVVRQFDTEQWKNLQSRLSLWKEHVGGMLETLKQTHSVATTPN